MEESGLDVVWSLFVVLAGVKAVSDVGAEVAAFPRADDGGVAVAEFVASSGGALVKTEAAAEVGGDVKALAADVGDAAAASVGVKAGDVCCVTLGEAPLGLILTCR